MIRTQLSGLDIKTEEKTFNSPEELKSYIASTGYPVNFTKELFEALASEEPVDWVMMFPNEYKNLHIWR